jgi:hypothetical protein
MSVPSEGSKIISLVSQGYYWEALGLPNNATSLAIHNAHLRLCHRFAAYPEVISVLNRAKAEIKEKSRVSQPVIKSLKFRQRISYYSNILTTAMANISTLWLVRFLAIGGTVFVLYKIHNVFFTLVTLITALFFVHSTYKGKFTSVSYSIAVVILLWGGSSATVYLVLGKIIPAWYILRIILGIVGGFGLFYCLACFMDKLLNRFTLFTIEKSIAIFCILFMFAFGITYLFSGQQQVIVSKVTTPKIIQSVQVSPEVTSPTITQTTPKIEVIPQAKGIAGILLAILKVALLFILACVVIGIYYGPNFLEKWHNFSEHRFRLAIILVMFTTHLANEALFYIPVIGKYIGGGLNIPRQVPEPILKHFAGFILFQIMICFLAFILYPLYVRLIKNLSRTTSLSVNARIWTFLMTIIFATSFVVTGMSFIGWKLPGKVGYAGFIDSVMGHKEITTVNTAIQPQNPADYKPEEKIPISRQPVLRETPQEAAVSKETKKVAPFIMVAKKELVNEDTVNIEDLDLVGIAIAGENSKAIITDKKTGTGYILGKGELLGEIEIEEIEKDKVTLESKGRKLELFLEK